MCVCATCCTYKHGLTPTCGGRVGSPIQRSSPPLETYLLARSWIRAKIAWGASSHCHVHLIFVLCHSQYLAQQGQDPHPYESSSCCLYSWCLACFWNQLPFTFIPESVGMLVCHLSFSSAQDKSTCVWFWRVVPSGGQIPGSMLDRPGHPGLTELC